MADAGRRPNFLVIVTDQQRADHLGCGWRARPWRAAMTGGRDVLRTPNLDRLAAEGVHFPRAYVNHPLCTPSRATLLTGRTPRGHGVRTNGIDLPRSAPTIVETLGQAGYRTHSVGKIHTRVYDLPRGADPESLDPAAFPESRWMWLNGKIEQLPVPYYGFQTADFTGYHGHVIFGDYLNWLRDEHPDAIPLLQPAAGQPAPSGAAQTFTMALPAALHYNTWIADRTIRFLEDAAPAAKVGRPFMVWCSFPDPHHPFCAPEPHASAYDAAGVPMPVRRLGELDDLAPHFREIYERPLQVSGRRRPTGMPDDQVRDIIAMTYGMVSFVDEQVGRLLKTLDRLELAKDTVVVFLSDHGELLGDHWLMNKGPFHFDSLLNVPLIYRWPGQLREGVTSPALASHLDFAPTILDLAGVAIPEGPVAPEAEAPRAGRPWPGESLVPVLTGQAEQVRDVVLVENDEDYLGLRLRTVITEQHQLTMYVDDDGEAPYGELFDMADDPGQLRNLWARPDAEPLKRELRERLLVELIRTESMLPRRLGHA